MAVKVREWKGAWWVKVDFKGRRKAKYVGPGKEGKRTALAAAKVISAKLALGDVSYFDPPASPGTPTVPPFGQLAEEWLTRDVPLRCKASTTARYRQALTTYWLPRFGDRRVTEITRDDVKAALADLGASLAKSTVRYFALPPLKGCLTYAVEQGVLVASPAGRVGRYVQDDRLPQERLDPFTAEELAAILTVAHDDFPAWYPAILTAARTGLRPCEWSALQRDDLDFRGGAVLVQRRVYCGQLSTPKTKKGRRVDMSTQLSAVLQGWLTLGAAEAAVEGRPPGPWLFPGPNGRPVRRQYFTDAVWRPILRRASVRYRPPVQLRHSYASLLIQQGESLAYVRDQLGHHSIKLTVDTYCHWLPGSNRQAVDRLDRIGPPLVHPGADPATIRNPGATAGRPSEPNAVVTRG